MVVSSFGIDKAEKDFYLVDQAKVIYEDEEPIKLPSGKVVKRKVKREYTPEPIKKTPEEMGWAKTVKFEDIILISVANPRNHGKLEKRLFHQIFEVDVKKYVAHHPCNICAHNNCGSNHHYFRAMPSGIFTICWVMACKYGRSASGPIQTHADREGNVSPWVKLVSEKKVTKKKAIQILKRLGRVGSMDVALYLKGFEVV